jgi:hypothetical protein
LRYIVKLIEQFESNKFDLHTLPDKIEEGQFLEQKNSWLLFKRNEPFQASFIFK